MAAHRLRLGDWTRSFRTGSVGSARSPACGRSRARQFSPFGEGRSSVRVPGRPGGGATRHRPPGLATPVRRQSSIPCPARGRTSSAPARPPRRGLPRPSKRSTNFVRICSTPSTGEVAAPVEGPMPGPSARAFGLALRRSSPSNAVVASIAAARAGSEVTQRLKVDRRPQLRRPDGIATAIRLERLSRLLVLVQPVPLAVSARSWRATGAIARSADRIADSSFASLGLVGHCSILRLTHNHPVKVSLRTHVNSSDAPGITSRFSGWRLFGAGVRAPERSPPWASRRSPAEVQMETYRSAQWRGRETSPQLGLRARFNFSMLAVDKKWVAGVELAKATASPQRGSVNWGRRPAGVDPSHPSNVTCFRTMPDFLLRDSGMLLPARSFGRVLGVVSSSDRGGPHPRRGRFRKWTYTELSAFAGSGRSTG